MPTDPPKTARQRALERRRRAQSDEDIGTPPKTPRSRRKADSSEGLTQGQRTKARASRDAKVVNLFGDSIGDEEERAAKVPTRAETKGQVRRRPATLGARWSEVVDRVRAGEYTWEEFCATLSPEELARGQLKDDKGGFRGRPPEFVPRQFILQCQREIFRRFNEKMAERLLGATDELIDLSREGSMEPKDRAAILKYLIERVMGPVPKEVIVSAEKPYEGLLAKIVSNARPISEGEDRYAKRRREE